MLNRFLLLFLLIFSLGAYSCLKHIDGPIDIEISPYPKLEVNLDQPNKYRNKVYYNLENLAIVKTSNSLDWNIAFTSNPNTRSKIIMNYALGKTCNGFTYNSNKWDTFVREDDYSLNTLYYANHYDSFANLFESNFTNGTNNGLVYYLNFGPFYTYTKFQILTYSATSVTFRYANIDGSNEKTQTIAIDPNTNYTYFSLKDNAVKDIEPSDKSSWDLEFTHYTTLVSDFPPTQMYAVTGVINNPSKNIKIAQIDNQRIENVGLTNISSINFSSELTRIGYNWKKFSNASQDGFYTIPTRTYVLKSNEKYYAIQFVEFSKIVDNIPVKGYPTFLQKTL